jgi:mitochondrial fission protein ELM1
MSEPRIWYVVGDRLGDNGQVEALIEALDLPCQRRYVRVKAPWIKGKPKVIPSLHHLDLDASDTLEPPWPDLLITVGRRLSMVAQWVQAQSGGHTRLVLIGKPSGSAKPYDLILVGPETQIPPGPKIMKFGLPLLKVDATKVQAAAQEWQSRFAELPRPLVAILVGGPTNPFVFNEDVTARMLAIANQVAGSGGTPYITTSPRTPIEFTAELRRRLPDAARLFEWRRGAPDNPYHALLGLADSFVVTGESISMLIEVAKLRKPLAIFPLPMSRLGQLDQIRRNGARWLYQPDGAGQRDRLRFTIRRIGAALHLLPHTRDFLAVHKTLINQGLAVVAGGDIPPPSGELMSDLPEVVARLRLLAQTLV